MADGVLLYFWEFMVAVLAEAIMAQGGAGDVGVRNCIRADVQHRAVGDAGAQLVCDHETAAHNGVASAQMVPIHG